MLFRSLGRLDDAVVEARAGFDADTDRYQAAILGWSMVVIELHHGKDEAAWNDLQLVKEKLWNWPGAHFGMSKPLVESLRLTARVRFGRDFPAPKGRSELAAALEAEGVKVSREDVALQKQLDTLLSQIPARQIQRIPPTVDAALVLVAKDRGSQLENQLVRPEMEAMLHVAKADALVKAQELDKARETYRIAQLLFYDDPWFEVKHNSVTTAEKGFDPVDLPRGERGEPE